jgi:hypothetical protein
VDIWGFIISYVPYIELLSNNYASLTKQELKIFNQLQFIFVEYLYNPRHEPINMKELYKDFNILGELMHIKLTGKKSDRKKTPSSSPTSNIKKSLAKGIHNKTRKNSIEKDKNTRVSFKRVPKKRRFKHPFFLSLK